MSDTPRKIAAAYTSATAINRAVEHLHQALRELDEAHTSAIRRGARLDAGAERRLYGTLSRVLTDPKANDGRLGLIADMRTVRDRRGRTGFVTFDTEEKGR